MQNNPWAQKYGITPAAPQQAPQQAPQTPGVIRGQPRAPDPYKVDQDRINNQNEAERLRLAQQAAEIAAEKARLDIAKAEREAAAGPAAAAAEGERKASGFLKRALNAENSYLNIENNPGPRSMVGQFMADAAPNLLNSLPADIGNSPERQSADQSQREFIAAVLRYDSGAAIPPEEFVTNARIYYPQPGDSPQVIEQKAQSRRVAIEGLRDSSGIMAPQSVATPEAAVEMTQGIAGAFAPQGSAPADAPPQGPTGNFAATVNTDALGPGEKFLFDETGTPIAIQAADGSISGYSAIVDNVSEREARQRLEDNGDMGYAKGGEAGLNRGVMLGLSDEIGGFAAGLGELSRGGEFGKGYREARDTERVAQDISRQEAGIAPELLGGLLIPGGALGQAKNAGQFVKQGATIGAVGGFGEGRGATNSLLSAGVGAGVGGALGGTLSQAPRAINALMQTGPAQKIAGAVRRNPAEVNREVIEAGQRQDIPIRQPDARPETRNAFAVVEASPSQGPKIKTTLDADKAAVQSRLEAVGGDGTRLDNYSMGETIQGAGKRYIADSGKKATALYQRAERAAGDVQILPVQASLAIRRNINELSASGEKGNSGLIKYLKELNDDLARDGGISIEALRATRTNMRGQISERNLTATDAERRVMQVLDAASTDIEKALKVNPDALGAFKAADGFYREKQTFIKDVVQRFTGSRNNPLSAEQAATKFQAMMRNKGDYKRFSEMTKRLEPEERRDMATSIAEELGKGRNGEFTLAGLATNIEKMNPRALRDLFGEDGAKALADLRVIARAKADTAGGLNNSKSGVVSAGTNQFKDVILGVVGGGIAGIPGAVTGMAARGGVERLSSARAARLLLNPDFTKWLRQTPPTTNPAVINRHFDRLNKIASREQVFLMDAKALQEFLAKQASEGVGRAAATGENAENNGRK